MPRWLVYAILSAVCAAMVGVLAKVGMKRVDPTLATAVRSVLMTLLLLGVCTAAGAWSKIPTLQGRAMAMIVCSGVAGALSWLFYFRAVQAGTVSQVAPIDKLSMPLAVVLAVLVLGERPTRWNWAGVVLIGVGAVLAAMPRPKRDTDPMHARPATTTPDAQRSSSPEP